MAVLFAEQADTSFDTVEGLQSFTNLPVLLAVPTISAHQGRNGGSGSSLLSSVGSGNDGLNKGESRNLQKHRLAVVTDPQSLPSEQYGILALKVQQGMAEGSRPKCWL